MSIIYHTVFAEAHCNEQSLAYFCPVCNQFCCSHCSNGSMFHDWSHICVHNEIEHKVEIENDFDEEQEIVFQEIDDNDDDENDYILDNIASQGKSYSQKLTHCGPSK